MPTYNRWDIVDAHYWFCTNYHEGQGSKLYLRLSHISNYYTPGIFMNTPRTKNAKAIYQALEAKGTECGCIDCSTAGEPTH
jgi:hypothetical protein